jgi:IS1 family transposase
VGGLLPMQCRYCNRVCSKKGFYKQVQKLYCTTCNKYQRSTYSYKLTTDNNDLNIALLTKECMSISSIARYLQLAKTTVRRRIYKISQTIIPPAISETNQVYEVDEMHTYIGRRHSSSYVYITYAINRATKVVTGFIIGSRTKETIGKLIEKLLVLQPRKIYTDGLNIYPSLIPSKIHCCFRYKTNIIERNNLSIRNSVKRLSRKTICYSKSAAMLAACMKIYFWSNKCS